MPIIKHSSRALVGNNDRIGVREIVDKKDGAAYLKLTEVIMDPGSEYKLHTHPTEQVVTVLGGSIQMVLDGEIDAVTHDEPLYLLMDGQQIPRWRFGFIGEEIPTKISAGLYLTIFEVT